MEYEKIIDAVEKYLRKFIVFILSFFHSDSAATELDLAPDIVNDVALFSIISIVLGAYIWYFLLQGQTKCKIDLPRIVLNSILVWLSVGIISIFVFRSLFLKVSLVSVVLSTFKVLSISHILAIYLGFVAFKMMNFDTPSAAQGGASRLTDVALILLYAIFYPRELYQTTVRANIPSNGKRRILVASALSAILPVFMGFTHLANMRYGNFDQVSEYCIN